MKKGFYSIVHRSVHRSALAVHRSALGLLLFLILTAVACTEPVPPADRTPIRTGISFLEENKPYEAMAEFEKFLRAVPDDCEARYGAVLASSQMLIHDLHLFNKSIFSFAVPEFSEYEELEPGTSLVKQAASGGLVEKFLVQGLLIPVHDHLAQLSHYADPVTGQSCTLKVALPWRLIVGRDRKYDILLEKVWGQAEVRLFNMIAWSARALVEITFSQQLEVPPLKLLEVYAKLGDRDLLGILRSLGALPAGVSDFLEFSPDPERRALFTQAEESFAKSFDNGAGLTQLARNEMVALSLDDRQRLISLLDTDSSGTMSPGDRFILNLGGVYLRAGELPYEIRPLELRVSEYLDPRPLTATEPESGYGFRTLDKTLRFIRHTNAILRLAQPVGSRIRIEELNGMFQAFGFNRPFEDVLEWDPNTFFRGRPLNEKVARAWPEGVTEGIKTLYIVSGSAYPDPPAPKPIRTFLPWYYEPYWGGWEFAIEGEKSYYYQTRYLAPWLIFGDFGHFFFDSIPATDTANEGGREVTGLKIPPDCISPPGDDTLGLLTVPYVALRDPTLNGSLVVNPEIISGGDCSDDTDEYVLWNPATHYSFNKILAHFVARFGLNVVDFIDRF